MKVGIAMLWLFLIMPNVSLAQSNVAEEAASVFEQFLALFSNLDTEGVVELFSEDALFWGTGSKTLVQDQQGIREYFTVPEDALPINQTASALEYSVQVLSDTNAIISGMWQVVPAGQTTGRIRRISIAVSKVRGEWKIVQFHNSPVPE